MEQTQSLFPRPAWLTRITLTLSLALAQGTASAGFADVAPGTWAAPYIEAIETAGITQGCGGDRFCPSHPVSRAQMAAFLIRALGEEPPPDTCAKGATFSDVSATSWACRYIKRLADLGVTTGCGGTRYCPEAVVTREQLAAFIIRAMEGGPSVDQCADQAPFADVPANSWACGHIKRLAEFGVVKGCGNGNFCPKQAVRRDEMAAFLARAFLGMGNANQLWVRRTGPGRVYGTGIDCGSLCVTHSDQVVNLLLHAEPAANGVFQGWGGACAAAGIAPTCWVRIEDNVRVSAVFGQIDSHPAFFPLNDTGSLECADNVLAERDCPVVGFPGQDAESGRDVTHDDDSDGWAGFSFTKLANSGKTLPNAAVLGDGANDWACTRDNVTGLVWEVKTDDGGPRDQDWTYSWYNPDGTTNGGDPGFADASNNCFDATRCNTHHYVADVNSQGLCGAKDWRLPSRNELESLVSTPHTPTIPPVFFPNTSLSSYWSSSTYARGTGAAWGVAFSTGYVGGFAKQGARPVRLVRGGYMAPTRFTIPVPPLDPPAKRGINAPARPVLKRFPENTGGNHGR